MTITETNLPNFMAGLWNSAVETGGNSRYCRALGCWLERKMPTEDYMLREYYSGRIIVYPGFPRYKHHDMKIIDSHELGMHIDPDRPIVEKKVSIFKRFFLHHAMK